MQVRSLLKLYADIEHTGRNQAFYEKFGCRQVIGEVLGEAPVVRFVPGSALRACHCVPVLSDQLGSRPSCTAQHRRQPCAPTFRMITIVKCVTQPFLSRYPHLSAQPCPSGRGTTGARFLPCRCRNERFEQVQQLYRSE